MSPDHITAGAYNQNIDKWLARHMVWLCETTRLHNVLLHSSNMVTVLLESSDLKL